MTGNGNELFTRTIRLVEEAGVKLERWMVLFERQIEEAEAGGRLPELKNLSQLLDCLKRSVEISKMAELHHPRNDDDGKQPEDLETLRRIFFEEA